jgi:hypothetical protein
MKLQSVILLLLLLSLLAAASIYAGVIPLKPGSTTVALHENAKIKGKGLAPVSVPNVSAKTSYSLDQTGMILTISVQNTSPAYSAAVLYALDLALPLKLVNRARLEAAFQKFPAGAIWEGPTDKANMLAPTGYCTFAAREAVLGEIEDYLQMQTKLTSGFLLPGQSGEIILKLNVPTNAANIPLRIAPVTYFLTPDPAAPTLKRVPVAIEGK